MRGKEGGRGKGKGWGERGGGVYLEIMRLSLRAGV